MAEAKILSRKPKDEPFRQQKLKAWQPILTPAKVIVIFFAIGVSFIPAGVSMIKSSNAIYESTVVYDGSNPDVDCSIDSQNEGKSCTVSFDFDKSVSGPLYVYYELSNFYQNHRRYVSSRNALQLMGETVSKSALKVSCDPLTTNGSYTLSPCGLIANSFFNDVFVLDKNSRYNLTMDETDISWESDRKYKFLQPSDFQYQTAQDATTPCTLSGISASDCKSYYDASEDQYYWYYYPNDDTTQYLYETYPKQISPIKGVTDEHFIVWMHTAALPSFRKLYGKIDGDFHKGQRISFSVTANFEVGSFDGSKALVISTIGEFGGRNPYLGLAYVVVGALCLFFGFLFLVKHLISPRELGDKKLLNWG